MQPATWHQYTYAILTAVPHDATPYESQLVVSNDGLHTWQLVSSLPSNGNGADPFSSDAVTPYQFWLNSTTGSLLVENDFFTFGTLTFWTSNDTGKSWKRIVYLSNIQNRQLNTIAVQTPMGNQPWHICIVGYGCTSDSGQTWNTRVGLKKLPSQNSFLAITDEGSILADGQASGNSSYVMYGLSAQGTTWTALGAEHPGPLIPSY